jgi:hypothetical protein
MTTDEIISEMKNKNISQSAVNSLEWILKTSDLVKFAKYQPLPDEHHRVMKQSYEFIEISYPKQPVQQLEEKS